MKHLEDVLIEYEFGQNMIGMTVISAKDQDDNPIKSMLQLSWLEEPAYENKPLEEIEENSKILLMFPDTKSIDALISVLEECKKYVPK